MSVDPDLLAEWAAAWAISRGKPAPVPVHNGFYLLDGRPQQTARYVFPDLREEVVRDMTARIDEPWVYLKFCAPREAVAALLPERWRLADPGYMMAAGSEILAEPCDQPQGYMASLTEQGGVVALSIATEGGEEAARGRLIPRGRFASFDQIETEETHRRRGLGRAVMRTLGREALRRGAEQGVLVATPAGRALYTSLGWETLSDYTSACLPG
ncbi:MAG: GNAT family N-acetyltransferase [Sphingomonadaceae bacterium]|nr:GNAT family N-acetyltransferase [Sphingomonadaceae bacterium]